MLLGSEAFRKRIKAQWTESQQADLVRQARRLGALDSTAVIEAVAYGVQVKDY